MSYNELISKTNDILTYINNNNNLDNLDEEFKEYKQKYSSLFDMIKNKEFDIQIFFQMIYILNKIDKKEITNYEGSMQFGSLLAKKYNIPINFNNNDLEKISKQYNIPLDDLKKHYSNLKK